MGLPLFKEQLHDIDIQFRRLGQRDTIWRRRAGCGLANSKRVPIADGHDLGDRSFAIQHRNRLAASYSAEVFAEPCLEFGDPYSSHSHIVTRISHDGKRDFASNRDTWLSDEIAQHFLG